MGEWYDSLGLNRGYPLWFVLQAFLRVPSSTIRRCHATGVIWLVWGFGFRSNRAMTFFVSYIIYLIWVRRKSGTVGWLHLTENTPSLYYPVLKLKTQTMKLPAFNYVNPYSPIRSFLYVAQIFLRDWRVGCPCQPGVKPVEVLTFGMHFEGRASFAICPTSKRPYDHHCSKWGDISFNAFCMLVECTHLDLDLGWLLDCLFCSNVHLRLGAVQAQSWSWEH